MDARIKGDYARDATDIVARPVVAVDKPPSICPFCNLDRTRVVAANDRAIAINDNFPVSPGHRLIIPVRHIASFFEATEEERDALFALLATVREKVLEEFSPDGFNVGFNDGASAGQTVMHLHIHLIPRYEGDQPDPRGGVRLIFPEKANYWSTR
jgi:diadenosine tetraphosphate (Ap4A) HIT family hydrolase